MPTLGTDAVVSIRTAADRPNTLGRVAVGALAISTLLFVPQLHSPSPAEAACGTRWPSRTMPPITIKVLRTATDKVQTVSFRRYVAVVMASGEWPTRLKPATLQAGAMATKQYAWFHSLKNKHRSGYVNGNGICYDVRDDVKDQLYRPERASPTKKQQNAIDKTWPLTLRKKERFFLTGYRQGEKVRCASDANGWKLFARSVQDCARKGWSRGRIQRAYYNPKLTIVRTEHVYGPLLRKPRVKLLTGAEIEARHSRVSWGKIASREPVKRYVLQRRTGKGEWRDVKLDDPKATKRSVSLATGKVHQFRVHAVDRVGERGPWARGPKIKSSMKGPRNATLSGPSSEVTRGLGGKARIDARFRSIAYVAPKGPNMGKAVIKVNGKTVKTLDLRRSSRLEGKLVWTKNWSKPRRRTVVVKPLRDDVRVEIDGFLTLR